MELKLLTEAEIKVTIGVAPKDDISDYEVFMPAFYNTNREQAKRTLRQVVEMFDQTQKDYQESKAYMKRFLVDDLLVVVEQLRELADV